MIVQQLQWHFHIHFSKMNKFFFTLHKSVIIHITFDLHMIQYFIYPLLLSLLSNIISVFISWYFLFRDPKFVSANEQIEAKQNQVKELEAGDDVENVKIKRKIKRLREEVVALQKEVSGKSLKSNLITALSSLLLSRIWKSYFENTVCARIPFTPFGIFTRISHRGIENDDMRDANFNFVFWLGSIAFRDILNKLFGFEVARMDFASMLNNPALMNKANFN